MEQLGKKKTGKSQSRILKKDLKSRNTEAIPYDATRLSAVKLEAGLKFTNKTHWWAAWEFWNQINFFKVASEEIQKSTKTFCLLIQREIYPI